MLQKFINYLLHNQVILALVLIITGWFIYIARGILVAVFIAYIITAAIMPIIAYLQSKRIPKVVAIMLTYFTVVILVFAIILPLVSFSVTQIQSLVVNLPKYLDQAAKSLGLFVDSKQLNGFITQEIDTLGQNAFEVTKQVFGGVFFTLTIFIIALYMTLYHDKFQKSVATLFKRDSRDLVRETMNKIDEKLGAWLRGQILLSISIFITTWVSLSIIRMPYALPLALLAGLLEIIPTLGPIIAAVPAVIVALTISPTMGLIVVGLYILIQIAENNFLVPKIMERAVGLNPIAIIVAIMLGAELLGVTGALLSIPFVSFLIVLFSSLQEAEID